MGNRAVIAYSTADYAPVVYLHWNGGRASVEAFLKAARYLGVRVQPGNAKPAMDALADIIARPFFGHDVGFNVYRETFGSSDTDNWDNGTYLIDEDLQIIGRLHNRSGTEEVNAEKTRDIFEVIVARAPVFNGLAA